MGGKKLPIHLDIRNNGNYIVGMMERVYLVEDGLSYGERFVFGRMAGLSVRGTVYIMDGLSKFAQDIGISSGSLLTYLRSLERKNLMAIGRRKMQSRTFVADLRLRLANGRWIKVPRSFLYVGNAKVRGLLCTLVNRAKKKKTAFYLRDLLASDVRSPKTLAKLIRFLQDEGFILIERTRPFYVVRVLL